MSVPSSSGDPKTRQYSKYGSESAEKRGRFTNPGHNTFADKAQDAVGLLCCKGALVTHVQLIVHKDP